MGSDRPIYCPECLNLRRGPEKRNTLLKWVRFEWPVLLFYWPGAELHLPGFPEAMGRQIRTEDLKKTLSGELGEVECLPMPLSPGGQALIFGVQSCTEAAATALETILKNMARLSCALCAQVLRILCSVKSRMVPVSRCRESI